MEDSCDVVVIGAGAAGLAAAARLSKRFAVTVIEARDRLGGRVRSHDGFGLPPIELGAEFMHGRPRNLERLAKRAKLAAYELDGPHRLIHEGRDVEGDEAFAAVTELLSEARRDLSFDEWIAAARPDLPVLERALARSYVEGFYAAEADRASMAAIGAMERAAAKLEGERLFKWRRPYAEVLAPLVASLRKRAVSLWLSSVVQRVRWGRGEARVEVRLETGERRRVQARAVLVTVPLGVLRAPRGAEGAIAFSPEPKTLRTAVARLESGPIVKLVLRFTEPVWPEGTSFLHAPSAPFPTFWTALPDPSPVITAWAGGGAALPLTALPRDALIAQALSTLRGLLGGPPLGRKLAGAWMHDWQADPYARGGYAWVPTGSVGAERALAAPIEGTLFFAGEATDPERSGTVDGALASGVRAAREVERALSTSRRTGAHRAARAG